MAAVETVDSIPWWKEPTRDQWYAWVAAWAGWTLDAFDFTAFLLIIVPIAKEFNVPVTEVTAVLTITLWMRLVGATANGWLADRIGRKAPLMISIAWYSVCNFLAGLAPSFFLLFLFRALLGSGMACRRRVGDGDLAGPLARFHGRGDAGLMGDWVFIVECALRSLLQLSGMARPTDDRHPACAGDHLHPHFCQRAGGLGREPAPADPAAPRNVLDF